MDQNDHNKLFKRVKRTNITFHMLAATRTVYYSDVPIILRTAADTYYGYFIFIVFLEKYKCLQSF